MAVEKVIIEWGVQNQQGVEQSIDSIVAGNKEIDSTAKGAGKSINSLVTELKNIKKELSTLDEGSEKFKTLSKRAGEVQDKIGDINTRIRTLASDTRKLDTVIQAATGIAAGFSIAQGASALFGASNKELEKSLLKVQSAMAILNGLQEIQNLLQRQTAIGAKAAAVSQAVYATAVGSSTGALKLFRLALLGTGLGAIALVLLAVATNFDKVKEVISKVIPESVQKAFTFLKDSLVGIYDGVKNFIGLGDAVKTNSTIYTAFGGALTKIQQPLKDIPGKLKEMNDKAKEQEAALKKLTDSGAPGSLGRYNFLLSEAQGQLIKLKPGTDAYAKQLDVISEALKNVADAELAAQAARGDSDISKLSQRGPIIPLDVQEEQQAKSLGSYQDFLKSIGVSTAENDAKIEERKKEDKEAAAQTTIDIAQATANSLVSINQSVFTIEKGNLDRQLKNKKISQEKYDKELKEIQTRNAKREKALNIFQSIINTAAAVVKMLSNPGGVAGIALSVAAGITGAIQTAAIASQPIPQFAKGVINLKGGIRGKDSIHALLMPGESVMTPEETAKHKSELTAMREGNYYDLIYRNHVLPAVMKVKVEMQNQLANLMVKATLDDSRIVKALTNQKQPKDINYNRLASLINSGNSNRNW